MRRPLTDRERLHARIVAAASAALRPVQIHRIMLIGGMLRGSWRHWHDNTAGSDCYGRSPHFHVHYCTNHEQPINGVIQ